MNNLNSTEKSELLRYFIGNPPYLQDGRFRDLVSRFNDTDERTDHDDVRYNVDYENSRIEDARDEKGSVPNDVGTVRDGKQVKPDAAKK